MSEQWPTGARRTRGQSRPSRTAQIRWKRWQATVGRHADSLRRRLAWNDLTEVDGRRVVASKPAPPLAALPEWTRIVRRFAEAARLGSAQVDGISGPTLCDANHPLPFEEVLLPLVVTARRMLCEQQNVHRANGPLDRLCGTVLTRQAYRQLERGLLRRLSTLAAPTLASLLAKRRSYGETLLLRLGVEAKVAPTRTVYQRLVSELLADGLVALFRRFPVLARILSQAVESWVSVTGEFLDRLHNDLSDVARTFGQVDSEALGPIVDIACDLSEPHNGGRTVAALTFASGTRVMYKPKDIGLEAAYTGLLRWINQKGELPAFWVQRVLPRATYGWVEYVATQPCASVEEVERFYQRAGMQLSLFYALGATDCHVENIVARRDQMVLVDMETLCHHRALALNNEENYFDSVLRTGMLPHWQCSQDTRTLADNSGLGVETESTVMRTAWRSVNTDAMHLAARPEPAPAGGNLPVLNGLSVPPNDHEGAFLHGFDEMYRFLVKFRPEVTAADGPLSAVSHQRARFIFRPTHIYVNVFEASLAPEHLRSGIDWSLAFEPLAWAFLGTATRPVAWPILQAEIAAMQRLDIPYFSASTSSATLDGVASKLRHYLLAPSYDDMCRRLATFGDADLSTQLQIIRATLFARVAMSHAGDSRLVATGVRDAGGSRSESAVAEDRTFLDEAREIGELLVTRAVGVSGASVNWLGLPQFPDTDRIRVNLLSMNLYDGVSGVALFLAALAHVTGRGRYGETARRALLPLRLHFREAPAEERQRLADRMGIGGGLGLGSLLYALTRSSALLDDGMLLEDAVCIARLLTSSRVRSDRKFDILGGAAGTALGLLVLYDATGERWLLTRALACGRVLLEHQIGRGAFAGAWPSPRDQASYSGFAHGAAGIGWALCRLYMATADRTFRRAVIRAWGAERRFLEYGESAHGRSTGQRPMASWCHGPPGVALAYLAGQALGSIPAPGDELAQAVQHTQQHGLDGVDHMCCGVAGRIETLTLASAVLEQPSLLEVGRSLAGAAIDRAKRENGYRLGIGGSRHVFENPVLFQGLAGIGYQLLRLVRPRDVPPILLWY